MSVGLTSELRDPAEPTEMPIGGTDFRRLKEPCDGEPDPHWKGHFVQQDPIGKDILMGNFAVRSPLEGAFRKGHFEVRHVLAMHSNVPSDDCGSGYSYRGGREVRRCAFFTFTLDACFPRLQVQPERVLCGRARQGLHLQPVVRAR